MLIAFLPPPSPGCPIALSPAVTGPCLISLWPSVTWLARAGTVITVSHGRHNAVYSGTMLGMFSLPGPPLALCWPFYGFAQAPRSTPQLGL